MKNMRALFTQTNSKRSGLRKLGGWLVFPLMIFSTCVPCHAQDVVPCGNSTVEDAWGPKVAAEAKSFLIKLQQIVKADDRKQFASLIHYPVRVWNKGRKVEIRHRRTL